MPIKTSGPLALIADIEAEFSQGANNISLAQAGVDAGLNAGDLGMFEFYGLSDVVAATVVTNSNSSIGSSSITANGNVTNDGGGTITSRGFYFGTSSNYASNTKYTVGSGTGSFSNNFTGLSSGTTYYATAWAINSAGEARGATTSSATSQPLLSTHISFSQTSGGGTHTDPPGTSGSFSANGSWSASGSYNAYGYSYASNGASHSYSGFYFTGYCCYSGAGITRALSGSKGANGTVSYSGRSPSTGGYAGGAVSFSKSGYVGFGATMAQRNFSYSDRRLKKNIKYFGLSELGHKLYDFEYIDNKYGSGVFRGVMSDEIPSQAVTKDKNGFDMVNYSMLGLNFIKI